MPTVTVVVLPSSTAARPADKRSRQTSSGSRGGTGGGDEGVPKEFREQEAAIIKGQKQHKRHMRKWRAVLASRCQLGDAVAELGSAVPHELRPLRAMMMLFGQCLQETATSELMLVGAERDLALALSEHLHSCRRGRVSATLLPQPWPP